MSRKTMIGSIQPQISELKQVTFLTTRTSTGSKVDVFHQSQPLTQSSDVTHAVMVCTCCQKRHLLKLTIEIISVSGWILYPVHP